MRSLKHLLTNPFAHGGESNYRSPARGSQVNNKSASTLYALVISQLKSRQLNESIESLRSAITLNPVDPNSYLALGVAHGEGGSLDQAEAVLKRA